VQNFYTVYFCGTFRIRYSANYTFSKFRIPRPGHTNFLFSGQKKNEISGHYSGHQNVSLHNFFSIKSSDKTYKTTIKPTDKTTIQRCHCLQLLKTAASHFR